MNATKDLGQHDAGRDDARQERAIEQVRESLRGLRFGVVTIIVQDGVVVQLERTEKVRFGRPAC